MNPAPNDLLLFVIGTMIFVWLSRTPLRHPGSHDFYRFFSWEAMLLLWILNRKSWGEHPFSAHQLASWPLLLSSVVLVILGIVALKTFGKPSQQRDDRKLYEFEKTTSLVTSGIFRYIRHPMYASLLFLTWGAYLQDPSWLGFALAVISSVFLLLTALTDEKECLEYFGEAYAAYIKKTWRFIPCLF